MNRAAPNSPSGVRAVSRMLRGLTVAALAALVLTSSACVQVVPYSPKRDKVVELGEEKAIEDLTSLLTQSTAWRYQQVEVTKERVSWSGGVPYYGPFGVHAPVSGLVRFQYVVGVRVHDNNVAHVLGDRDQQLMVATLPSLNAAYEFADLMMSFRENAKGSPAEKPADAEKAGDPAPEKPAEGEAN